MLLEHNAEVNARDSRGRVPLHDAAYNGHLEVVRSLLKHGGDVNARGNEGRTPLDEAKARGFAEIVELLSERMNE
ncbi:ankyrin repeat-containing domain protein [Lactarius indigo]|nr:ankyrin repeat-containing domain protein [Lactarius indigo]